MRNRVSIWNLMAVVFLVAVGFLALTKPTEMIGFLFFSTTLSLFVFTLLGAITKRGNERNLRSAFVMFGASVLLIAFAMPNNGFSPENLISVSIFALIVGGFGSVLSRFYPTTPTTSSKRP